MKKKLIITSVMTIVVCLSLITGATFAYFTSQDDTSIAVSSAKVEITATIDQTSLEKWSLTVDRTAEDTFTNGGTATFNADGGLELELVSPGDGVAFDIAIDNGSNIAIKYNVRMIAEVNTEGKTAEQIAAGEVLRDALVATAIIDGAEYAITGTECETGFISVDKDATIDSISVTVELPKETGNAAQDGSITIKFIVEAVQGNGEYAEETTSNN